MKFGVYGSVVTERKPGLWFFELVLSMLMASVATSTLAAGVAVPCAIKIQPARYFHAPFRLGSFLARAISHSYRLGDFAGLAALGGIHFTEGTTFGVV